MLWHAPRFYPLVDQFEHELRQRVALHQAGLFNRVTVQPVTHPKLSKQTVQLDMLRLDTLHPVISGNKWFKLKYQILYALRMGCSTLVSFGGAWSNHLHSLAYCARVLGLKAVGIVRGEEHSAQTNAMLADVSRWGMRLRFVERQQFRRLCLQPAAVAEDASQFVIPEGGDSWLGVMGASTIVAPAVFSNSNKTYQVVVTPVGTGCTLAGLRLGLPNRVELLGLSAVKGRWQIRQMHNRLSGYEQATLGPWQLTDQYCRGGFGKTDKELMEFTHSFKKMTGIYLDPLYGAKAMMGLFDLLEKRIIPPESRILFVHSGGLQGWRGLADNPLGVSNA